MTGAVVLWLGRYRHQFSEHYQTTLVPDRSLRPLLFLAAVFADFARHKQTTAQLQEDPSTTGSRHTAALVAGLAQQLALSGHESAHLERVIRGLQRVRAMAAAHLAQKENALSRRAIYHFFKDSQQAGPDACLLALADLRAIYEAGLPQDLWQAQLETCRALLEAYWEKREEIVNPPRMLTGDDLMGELNIKPGRAVGLLLALIEEAQAAGEITTAGEAVAFARLQYSSGLFEARPKE
jgi:hypothetical protein